MRTDRQTEVEIESHRFWDYSYSKHMDKEKKY